MASTITNYSNLINVNFPISGADNDSQGFRTNYIEIQAALKVASDEISALQLKLNNPADVKLNNYTASELYNLGTDLDDGTMVFLTTGIDKLYQRPAYFNSGTWYVVNTGTAVVLP